MEWISVKDRLPENEESIIIFDGREVFSGIYINGYFRNHDCEGLAFGPLENKNVSHWMPLPKPPKKNG